MTPRLGFFGPFGTYTHEALRRSARVPAGGAEQVPLGSERETILAVAAGEVGAALVPIENALEGAVTATLDTLTVDAPAVRIVGEEVLAIRHCLAVRPGVALEDVEAVTSHPQALAQCRRFLRDELPGRRIVAATSTAEAVRLVATEEPSWAAIGPRGAAELLGADVVREGIEDEPGNATRFVWIGPEDGEVPLAPAPPGAGWKTTLMFYGAGDESPGWLVRCLSEFAFRGLNLTKIESRPRRLGLGHYLFLVDLDGREEDDVAAAAIDGLRAQCESVRVLGSYPSA